MGWDLEVGCGCGEELKNLEHLFLIPRFPGFVGIRKVRPN